MYNFPYIYIYIFFSGVGGGGEDVMRIYSCTLSTSKVMHHNFLLRKYFFQKVHESQNLTNPTPKRTK